MGGLVRPTSSISWELRGKWASRKWVRLTLSERCVVEVVIGRISRVATTGAFVVCDGWEIPMGEILAVGSPDPEEREAYMDAKAERALARGEDHL